MFLVKFDGKYWSVKIESMKIWRWRVCAVCRVAASFEIGFDIIFFIWFFNLWFSVSSFVSYCQCKWNESWSGSMMDETIRSNTHNFCGSVWSSVFHRSCLRQTHFFFIHFCRSQVRQSPFGKWISAVKHSSCSISAFDRYRPDFRVVLNHGVVHGRSPGVHKCSLVVS